MDNNLLRELSESVVNLTKAVYLLRKEIARLNQLSEEKLLG
jgi:hypothetical protein